MNNYYSSMFTNNPLFCINHLQNQWPFFILLYKDNNPDIWTCCETKWSNIIKLISYLDIFAILTVWYFHVFFLNIRDMVRQLFLYCILQVHLQLWLYYYGVFFFTFFTVSSGKSLHTSAIFRQLPVTVPWITPSAVTTPRTSFCNNI